MKFDRRDGIMVSIPTIIAVLASIATSYPIAQKVLAGEITEQVKPLYDAQIITISATVRNLQNAIVALEFKRDNCSPKPDCWTLRDAQDLTGARTDLTAAQDALTALRK